MLFAKKSLPADVASSTAAAKAQAAQDAIFRTALKSCKTNIMMADADYNIFYCNDSMNDVLDAAEGALKEYFGDFDKDKVIGSNIDIFHKKPSHQRGILDNLQEQFTTQLQVGRYHFELVITPIFDGEKRTATVVEWADISTQKKMQDQEKQLEEEFKAIIDAGASGDFTKRAATEGKEGFMLSLSTAINNLCATNQEVLDQINIALGALAEGDLQYKITEAYEGIFEQIKENFNSTTQTLQELVIKIQGSSASVAMSAKEIADGSHDLAQRTEQQAITIQETASSSKDITAIVEQNSTIAGEASNLSQQAAHEATKGAAIVKDAVKAMDKITDSSNKVAEIISLIDDIAFQTNLLALNAAVEAARAGEAGRGFAVVASEVRSLAGRSAQSSKEIKDLIQESVKQVETGSTLVHDSGEALQTIEQSVLEVNKRIRDIAEASQKQTTGITTIDRSINDLEESTQQNAALVEESTAASQSMADQSAELQRVVGFFKTGQETGGTATPVAPVSTSPAASAAPSGSSISTVSAGSVELFDEPAPAPKVAEVVPITKAKPAPKPAPAPMKQPVKQAVNAGPANFDDDGWESF